MKKTFALLCMTIAIIFGALETKHFGYNIFPATLEELLCDTVSILLWVCGFIILRQTVKDVEEDDFNYEEWNQRVRPPGFKRKWSNDFGIPKPDTKFTKP